MVFRYVEGSRHDNDGSPSLGGHGWESLGPYSFQRRILDHLNPGLITNNVCSAFAHAFGFGRFPTHFSSVIP